MSNPERKKVQKERKSLPVLTGTMTCYKGHAWTVLDLNPERSTTFCPVCGALTSIKTGYKNIGGIIQ